jgi:isoleucyl-tRNA synthetase
VTLAALAAPFVPFFSEEMYQNLVVRAGVGHAAESVHLARYPEADASVVDERLAEDMAAVREIVSLGLSVRTANRLKVRQPLARADVVLNEGSMRERLAGYRDLIGDELNVHELVLMYPGHEQGAVSFKLKPNFRALGPRLGKGVQAVKRALEAADGSALHAELSRSGKLVLQVEDQRLEFGPEEIEVAVEAAEGFAAETGRAGVVVLHTTLTDALVDEGILREVLSRIQAARKDRQLAFTDRVEIWIDGSERLMRVARAGKDHIARECLGTLVHIGERGADANEHALGDETLVLCVRKASS